MFLPFFIWNFTKNMGDYFTYHGFSVESLLNF